MKGWREAEGAVHTVGTMTMTGKERPGGGRKQLEESSSCRKTKSREEMVTCAVNGFGRIGRLVFRYAWDDPLLDIVHVNDLCSVESAAYLIKYDSVHGTWDKEVEVTPDGKGFTVDGKLVTFTQESDFNKVGYKEMNVELMMECTGKFLTVDKLEEYYTNCGCKRVVVSAPVKQKGALNVVLGCNHELLSDELKLVTNASCTTNW